jgi:hypothetical protein
LKSLLAPKPILGPARKIINFKIPAAPIKKIGQSFSYLIRHFGHEVGVMFFFIEGHGSFHSHFEHEIFVIIIGILIPLAVTNEQLTLKHISHHNTDFDVVDRAFKILLNLVHYFCRDSQIGSGH